MMAAELIEHPKEHAEHVMLVDLARNDVGRVAEFGSVNVDELMTLERYSHVMHLTSQVLGRLRDGLGPIDVLRATLPAGTVSGAPKVRAMEIIDSLEPVKRGPYAGVVGYIDWSGNLDTAITIRTMFVTGDGTTASLQAGAGIVADSIPDDEDLECRNKAAALLAAIPAARRMTSAAPRRRHLCLSWARAGRPWSRRMPSRNSRLRPAIPIVITVASRINNGNVVTDFNATVDRGELACGHDGVAHHEELTRHDHGALVLDVVAGLDGVDHDTFGSRVAGDQPLDVGD